MTELKKIQIFYVEAEKMDGVWLRTHQGVCLKKNSVLTVAFNYRVLLRILTGFLWVPEYVAGTMTKCPFMGDIHLCYAKCLIVQQLFKSMLNSSGKLLGKVRCK